MAAGTKGELIDADVRRYYAPMPDASHPMVGWYVRVLDGMPIGPFPDQERAERAVEALSAAIRAKP